MSIRKPLGAEPRAGNEFATLGGGCFWCLEAVYEELEGVVDVESGYSGGHDRKPTYEQVCRGATGHAEVVRIEFDPARIGYRDLLEVFFSIHDPTQLNRQGNDVGTQYRSVVFVHSDEQRRIAEEVIAELRQHVSRKLVTEVLPAPEYFRAETYHQEYFRQNPGQGYCMFVVAPKVGKFRKTFAAKRRKSAED
ncbi:MAG: peptide-methionine (S)-S-oxide reductase MsrA [Burkholderiaceae bacterium]|jgi:peptide-methionine (S)-S-oxide reductase|nr:peptide-methionine (S)-S-oxide reductase MsrA [Burkholderiaceae bacterium]MDH5209667.1 peptide-methionine (S)-S-oxide reductase MsrA [Burkholderiaceae bacterium]